MMRRKRIVLLLFASIVCLSPVVSNQNELRKRRRRGLQRSTSIHRNVLNFGEVYRQRQTQQGNQKNDEHIAKGNIDRNDIDANKGNNKGLGVMADEEVNINNKGEKPEKDKEKDKEKEKEKEKDKNINDQGKPDKDKNEKPGGKGATPSPTIYLSIEPSTLPTMVPTTVEPTISSTKISTFIPSSRPSSAQSSSPSPSPTQKNKSSGVDNGILDVIDKDTKSSIPTASIAEPPTISPTSYISMSPTRIGEIVIGLSMIVEQDPDRQKAESKKGSRISHDDYKAVDAIISTLITVFDAEPYFQVVDERRKRRELTKRSSESDLNQQLQQQNDRKLIILRPSYEFSVFHLMQEFEKGEVVYHSMNMFATFHVLDYSFGFGVGEESTHTFYNNDDDHDYDYTSGKSNGIEDLGDTSDNAADEIIENGGASIDESTYANSGATDIQDINDASGNIVSDNKENDYDFIDESMPDVKVIVTVTDDDSNNNNNGDDDNDYDYGYDYDDDDSNRKRKLENEDTIAKITTESITHVAMRLVTDNINDGTFMALLRLESSRVTYVSLIPDNDEKKKHNSSNGSIIVIDSDASNTFNFLRMFGIFMLMSICSLSCCLVLVGHRRYIRRKNETIWYLSGDEKSLDALLNIQHVKDYLTDFSFEQEDKKEDAKFGWMPGRHRGID